MNTEIKLILPNNNLGVILDLQQGERLYFLAGPIKGGGTWHKDAIELLHKKDPFCYIVCPKPYDSRHRLRPTKQERSTDDERGFTEYALRFPSQTAWERYYLERASYYGSVIFWLPQEDVNEPRKDGSPYARDTYGELGRWSLRSSKPHYFCFKENEDRVNLVIGAEKYFPGLSVIQKNLDGDHGSPFQIYTTLEDTISEAVKLGKKSNPQPMNFND